ncbi:protein translocase subunit SecD [Magnetofaba australis]|uniref:Protein translocase subunit SecD n=1 Tax=Magnetofaba australis IT-1 TaxID=1434232 RepID=A0A1Y2K204_9PROT|nr:protein translocase subunit SecD [Magnetofaba australis]OSM02048.1 putative protein-export membrane protein SecD [Magnetofaba australis IT-1]
MRQLPIWKPILVIAVSLLALYFALPTLYEDTPPAWLKGDKIHQGLDLQGGLYLLYEVEVEKAVEQDAESLVDTVKSVMRDARFRYRSVARSGVDRVTLRLSPESEAAKIEAALKKEVADVVITPKGADGFELVFTPEKIKSTEEFAVQQAIQIMRARIDEFGVAEPSIQKQGKDRIIIQLPGVKEPERAKNLIGRTARLEFKIVDDKNNEQALATGRAPPGTALYSFQDKGDGIAPGKILLKKRTVLSGKHLDDARPSYDQYNMPYVSVKFDRLGGRIFARLTGEHVNDRMAIVLDGVVFSAPVIREKIVGGQASISGSFSPQDAHDLAIVLRAGALPAPLKILEERTVGPTLGRDSVNQGINSIVIGGILVVIFMALYYKGFGMLANVAVVLNIIILIAVLAGMQATLTLPGLAGTVLLLGMAVDANVLIFERIREELRSGKTPLAAIDHGYGKAFSTILDANITTLITAIVLFQFGTGPVRGFAVTLSIGLVASMFTAIFVTRVLLAMIVRNRRLNKLSI